MRRARTIRVAFAIGSVLLTACGDDGPDATGDTRTTPSASALAQEGAAHDGTDDSPVAADARHVEVTARSFDFDPDEITVEAGEDIAIVLTSEDSLHDFIIDDLDAHIAAESGETAIGGFRAEEPRRYPFYCSVAGHREAGMEGTLVVEL